MTWKCRIISAGRESLAAWSPGAWTGRRSAGQGCAGGVAARLTQLLGCFGLVALVEDARAAALETTLRLRQITE